VPPTILRAQEIAAREKGYGSAGPRAAG